MSSILKALEKLERKKPDSHSAPPREPEGPPPKRGIGMRASLTALSLGALVGLAVAAWWTGFGGDASVDPAVPASEQRRPERQATRPPRLAEPAQRTGAHAPEAQAAPAPATPISEPQPGPPLEKPRPEPQPVAVAQPATQKPPPAAVAPPATRKPPPAVAPKPPPPRVAKPKPAPPPRRPQPRVAEVPMLPVPDLVVATTSWHPDPNRRSATIELEGRDVPLELHHGDAVGPLVVHEIQPSGIVFRLGEVEVVRRVGQSTPR